MRIFLSYRRDDASAWAGRLRDDLAARFGEQSVFQDVVAVRPGRDFAEAVDGALEQSDVVLAVIGPHWLTVAGADGHRRLNDADDHVRYEIGAALVRVALVVPVLVGRAAMPASDELPDDLKALALRQAVSLRDETWRRDVDGLIQALGVDPSARRRRSRLLVGVAIAALLVAGVIAVAAVLARDDPNDSSASTSSAPSTTFDPFSLKQECTSTGSDWSSIAAAGPQDIGTSDNPSARVSVVDGRYRSDQDDRWRVLLDVEYISLTDGGQSQYWWYYELAADGERFEPSCFNVKGGTHPACCGESTEVLVGFDITADPTSGGTLKIDNSGDIGQIQLSRV